MASLRGELSTIVDGGAGRVTVVRRAERAGAP
jgi:hypothetical protein